MSRVIKKSEDGEAVNTVIFDFGGVMSLPQNQSVFSAISLISGMGIEELRERYWSCRGEYDAGKLTSEEYWMQIVGKKLLTEHPEYLERLVHLDVMSWTRTNMDMIPFMKSLKQKQNCTLGVLSNLPWELMQHVRLTQSWIDLIDASVFSCAAGVIKPDPHIYKLLLARLDRRPEECLFIDDTQENIQAAADLGMRTVHFTSVNSAREETRDLFKIGA